MLQAWVPRKRAMVLGQGMMDKWPTITEISWIVSFAWLAPHANPWTCGVTAPITSSRLQPRAPHRHHLRSSSIHPSSLGCHADLSKFCKKRIDKDKKDDVKECASPLVTVGSPHLVNMWAQAHKLLYLLALKMRQVTVNWPDMRCSRSFCSKSTWTKTRQILGQTALLANNWPFFLKWATTCSQVTPNLEWMGWHTRCQLL